MERGAFDGAHAGGAHADDAAGGVDLCGSFRADFVVFLVELAGAQVFLGEGLEGAEADVERDFGAGRALGENLGREVQAGGGRGGGAGVAGEDGLVALAVRGFIGTLEVGGQGHVADAF